MALEPLDNIKEIQLERAETKQALKEQKEERKEAAIAKKEEESSRATKRAITKKGENIDVEA